MNLGTFQNPFVMRPPPAVRALLIANGVVLLVQGLVDGLAGRFFSVTFALNLHALREFHIWQPFTYMFLHGGFLHLLMNMLMLYFFGCELERVLGTARFLRLYLGSGVLAGVGWLVIDGLMGRSGLCMGASGATLGLVGAFAALFPDRVITLLLFFVFPVTMTARTMAIGIGLMSLVMMMSSDGNVAHSAHLAGGIAGYIHGLRLARVKIFFGLESSGGGRGGVGAWLANWRAVWRRRAIRLHTSEPRTAIDEPPTREEVDRLLGKISVQGIESLSQAERRRLESASRAYTETRRR